MNLLKTWGGGSWDTRRCSSPEQGQEAEPTAGENEESEESGPSGVGGRQEEAIDDQGGPGMGAHYMSTSDDDHVDNIRGEPCTVSTRTEGDPSEAEFPMIDFFTLDWVLQPLTPQPLTKACKKDGSSYSEKDKSSLMSARLRNKKGQIRTVLWQ